MYVIYLKISHKRGVTGTTGPLLGYAPDKVESRWHADGEQVELLTDRLGFRPWPGSLCCVSGQDTNSHSALSSHEYIQTYF